MGKFHVQNFFFFSLKKFKQFLNIFNVHFSIHIVYFLYFKLIYNKNITITTKSKSINMGPLAPQQSEESFLLLSQKKKDYLVIQKKTSRC